MTYRDTDELFTKERQKVQRKEEGKQQEGG